VEHQSGCKDFAVLVFHLKRMLDRVASRLRGKEKRASKLKIELKLDTPQGFPEMKRAWEIALPRAQAAALGMLSVVRERLGNEIQRTGLAEGVLSASIEVTEMASGAAAQKDFLTNRDEEAEAVNTLVNRLSEGLGSDQVFLAMLVQRYLPERAWKRHFKEPDKSVQKKTVQMENPPRPLRMLREPRRLQKTGDVLLDFSAGQKWQIRAWEGPERLSGEWWKSRHRKGFQRDYYRVFTQGGERLWLFKKSPGEMKEDGELFLQGVFD
jgi:protein ImuB